jgi:hypothetical protein
MDSKLSSAVIALACAVAIVIILAISATGAR